MAKREPHWHKSSYSGGSGSCVEVAEGQTVLVRDTRNREHGHLDYTPEAWTALLSCASLTNS
ncbi:DUF397 domain-containing protein [Nocardiopsis sp. RV163]|uniref:DUF397 domain-containing protein n=1 Tax=Nocardiopsis sp. RV163 TaxID=1661388 RepID=UPI00064B99CE|nr:DUF397 domain-containing protein [Nocardiopsis sp. RV163]